MTSKYYFINRPPFIGTHPKGEISREVWQPKQSAPDINEDWTFHGFVEYEEPLSNEDIWEYQLMPAKHSERDTYWQWRDDNNK
jgi:hypothetical protein